MNDNQDNNMLDKVSGLEADIEKLRQELDLYKNIFEKLPFGIQVFDKNGYSHIFNPKQKELPGVRNIKDKAGKFNVLSDLHSVSSGTSKIFEKVYRGGTYNHRLEYNPGSNENIWDTRKETRFFNETIFPLFNQSNQVEYVIAVLEDITDTNLSEHQIREAEERFRLFFEENLATMIIIDPETHAIVEANQAAEKFYGYSAAQLKSLKIDDINTLPPHQILTEMAKAREKKQIYFEFQHHLANGEIKDVEIYTSSITIKNQHYLFSIVHDITQRKKYEQQLKEKSEEYLSLYEEYKTNLDELLISKEKIEESEMHFRLLVENAPDAIFIQVNHKFSYVNKACMNLYGATNEKQLLETSIADRIHPDFRELVKERINDLNHNIKPVSQIAYKHVRLDGTFVDVEVSAVPYQFQGQNGALVFVRDISSRLNIEQEILRKNEEFEKFFDCSLDLLCITSINGEFIQLNKEWEFVLGYKMDELRGRSFRDFVHPEDFSATKDVLNRLADQHKILNFTNRFLSKDGNYRWIEWRSIPMGNIVYAAARDVTEQRIKNIELTEAKEKAEKSEKSLSQTLSKLNEAQIIANMGNWEWNLVTGEIWWSVQLYRIFDVDPETYHPTIEGNAQFVHHDDNSPYHTAMADAINNHKKLDFDLRIITPAGKLKYCKSKAFVDYDDQGKPIRMAGTFRDISQQVHDQTELVKAKEKAEESDKLKTAFLQNLSHEIRTPLNAIIGFSEMMNSRALTNEKKEKFVNIVIQNSHQLLSIVSDILSISSIETKQERLCITQVSINKIIDNLYDVFIPQAQIKNIELRVSKSLNDDQSEIFGDGTKIFQVVNNLITNAFKFTSEGFIEFGYHIKNHLLEFYVKDSGIGIDKTLHEKIFERFRQAELSSNRKYGGTGLGLSISKGLAELMDGNIFLESTPGSGSTFYFSIPYFSAVKINYLNPNFKVPVNSSTILIVDDEESNSILLEEILSDYNFKIIVSKDGTDAINKVKENPDINLIFMDIKMPVLDGYSATRIIKTIKPSLPVIAQSAYALDFEIEKFGGIFNSYITKPIKKDILIAKLQEFLIK